MEGNGQEANIVKGAFMPYNRDEITFMRKLFYEIQSGSGKRELKHVKHKSISSFIDNGLIFSM